MEYDIKDLTKEELLSPELIPQIYENYSDKTERGHILDEIYKVAKDKEYAAKLVDNGKLQLQIFDNYEQRTDKLVKILEDISN